MKWALVFGIPLAALGVASWSAWQVQQQLPGHSDGVVMMLPGEMPALNPFLPANEAERQMLDLLHEPLIRLDSQGRLSPGLAKTWSWHQRVTCWFATQDDLQAAQRRLAEVPPLVRQAWELDEVSTEAKSLVMRFSKPGASGTEDALKALSELAPVPLSFLRITNLANSRAELESFIQDQSRAASSVRVWFDEDGTCELVSTRSFLRTREELAEWFRQKKRPVPHVALLAEVVGLLEPVLDFELNVNRAVWPDGTPVTAADVQATVEHVSRLKYPVPGREGFRHIQEITPLGSRGVRVTYRRNYGAALASWVGFPILPEAWLKNHPQADGSIPPGAGEWHVTTNTQRQITLAAKTPSEDASQSTTLHVISSTSDLQARVALATGTLDVIWPGQDSELRLEPTLNLYPTPPRNRLLLLCNMRSSRLSELPVREALSLALDRQSLIEKGLDGQARLAEALFTPGLWYSPKATEPTFDLAAAREKLEAAGWIRDVSGQAKKGGQGLDFELLVTTGNAQREHLAELLAQQWERIGAHVTVTSVPPENLVSDYLAPGKFDAVLIGRDYELAWDQTAYWHTEQMSGGLNFAQLADPQLDLLLEALSTEFDTAQLPTRAQAVQDRLMRLRPVLPLLGDLQQLGLRKVSFPQLPPPDLQQPLSLRELLRGRTQSPQMLLPNE